MKTIPCLPSPLAKFAALLATLCTGISCSEISYYKQAIDGHLEITTKQRPLDSVINHRQTSETVRERLKLVQRILAFEPPPSSAPPAP